MPTTAEIENLRQLCVRACAVTAGETPVDAYIAFYGGGRSSRDAKVLAAEVAVNELDSTLGSVNERVNMLLSEGVGRFWVRLYQRGKSHHMASVVIEAEPGTDTGDDPLEDKGSGVSLATAHAKVVLALARTNVELTHHVQHLNDRLAETQVSGALYHLAALTTNESSNAAAVQAAIQAVAPTLEAAVPVLIQEYFRERARDRETAAGVAVEVDAPPASDAPPTDPGGAIDYHLAALERHTEGLYGAASSAPEHFNAARRGRVMKLLERFGVQPAASPTDGG